MKNLMDEVLNEHIRMPGVYNLIVTRAFAYSWLKASGRWPEDATGFGSLDYAAFGKERVHEPLTDEKTRDEILRLCEEAV